MRSGSTNVALCKIIPAHPSPVSFTFMGEIGFNKVEPDSLQKDINRYPIKTVCTPVDHKKLCVDS